MQDRIGSLFKAFSYSLPVTMPGDNIASVMPNNEKEEAVCLEAVIQEVQ